MSLDKITCVCIIMVILIGSLFLFFILLQKQTCEDIGLEYNWEGECIQHIGDRVIKYDIESTDWTGIHLKVNKYPSVPT